MSGDEGDRTLDLIVANDALSQLSYVPVVRKEGIDPSTSGVSSQRSTNELLPRASSVELIGIEPTTS